MKCKNCGLPKDVHIKGADGDRTIWRCPNDPGEAFPATLDVKVELHYRAGEQYPWIAKCTSHDRDAGPWEFAAGQPLEALDLAARKIEKSREEKTPEEKDVEAAIAATRDRSSH